MSRTITALFDTRADAEAGGERLKQAGVDATHVAVHDQSTHTTTGKHSSRTDKGLWASVKSVFVPDADRHTYEEGIRRGGFLLTADVEDDHAPAAVKALEDANAVDLDARSAQWRDDGWDYQAGAGDDLIADASDPQPWGDRDPAHSSDRYRTYGADVTRN